MLSLWQKKFIIPNSDNFGASSSEVAVATPFWLSSESEDDESPTHKLEVDTCVMAMENEKKIFREVDVYRMHVRNYTHKEACARRLIIADLSPLGADSKIPAIFRIMPE